MTRSIKKGPYIDMKLLKKIRAMNESGQKRPVRVWCRSCIIAPDFVGHTIEVHNGKRFIAVYVTDELVGHRLGEFSPTRTFRSHARGEKTETK